MLHRDESRERSLRTKQIECDLVVVGGGIAGVCAAVTAARCGLRVTLVQDRPVLGGNASSEVRLWILGATSHLGNNNRWSREGGVLDELLCENMFRNREGNPLIFDTILLEWVRRERNITLLLNTAAFDVGKRGPDRIEGVRAFCSQNSTMYDLRAPFFCDASGDGVVGFLAGAAFRIGAETREEFDEGFAPDEAFGHLLGHSIYFYSKDTGRPVEFVPPSFALDDIRAIPRYRTFNAKDQGCQLWWIEYGGRLDTIHDTEEIKWELWRVVYGVWNHIKNSGEFPEAETMTLEWVGTIPGKRESRRFEGDTMLTQRDIVEQRRHADAVSFGGWALDLHPADGVYSEGDGCVQYHSKGVYQIPYRSMYSRNIENLFLAGRIISTSHVAFGSTRVMATCGHNAQTVGVAAALCLEHAVDPRGLVESGRMEEMQRELLRRGQHIPGVALDDPDDLVRSARLSATSTFDIQSVPVSDEMLTLEDGVGNWIPVRAGALPGVTLMIDAASPTDVVVEARTCSRHGSFTPDTLSARAVVRVEAGERQQVHFDLDGRIEEDQYVLLLVRPDPALRVATSDLLVTGLVSATNRFNRRVAKSSVQQPPEGSGIDRFEFWRPLRRPAGRLVAMSFDEPLPAFSVEHLGNGFARPTTRSNAWVARPDDPAPAVTCAWDEPRSIARIELDFDTDWDHPMESTLMGHPERIMPQCVRSLRVVNVADDRTVAVLTENHQTRRTLVLDEPIETSALRIEVDHTPHCPASLFGLRVYGKASHLIHDPHGASS